MSLLLGVSLFFNFTLVVFCIWSYRNSKIQIKGLEHISEAIIAIDSNFERVVQKHPFLIDKDYLKGLKERNIIALGFYVEQNDEISGNHHRFTSIYDAMSWHLMNTGGKNPMRGVGVLIELALPLSRENDISVQ